MKPLGEFSRIFQEKFKKCLLLCTGIFLCMCWPGISAGATCGRPGRPTMSRTEPSKNEFNVNDTIHYICIATNHVVLGNPERYCLKNGSWSDEMPVCSKVAAIEKVELSSEDSESEDQNAQITIDGNISTCSDASRFNGRIWRGHLTTSINISAVRIALITVKEAVINVQVLEENSDVRRKCEEKSEYEGLSIKSIKTFTFSCPAATFGKHIEVSCNNQSLSICEVSVLHLPNSSCLTPDRPLHGQAFKSYNKVLNEEIYNFQCDEGYKLWGPISVTCQTDGRSRWSPKSPSCEKIYCHIPEDIENGYVEHNASNVIIPYNGTVTFSCKEGFYLSGKSVIRCHKWHQWDSPPPVCKLKVTTENTNSARILPQTERWRQDNVTHCGNLPNVANGVLIANSSHVGSFAQLKCLEGFKSLSDNYSYCMSSGKWSSHNLHCKMIQCEDNPIIPYGKAILLDGSLSYGSHLQILCNEGYMSHTTIIRACDENGSWGDLNICIEITCGAFNTQDVNNGQWMAVNGSTSLYVLVCLENFHIEGSPAVIRCLSNGSWSYTSAKCQKSFTSFWGNNWTPSLVLIAAVAAGVATAIVILCLSVAFVVIKKRRKAQTNTTVFHEENPNPKDRIKQINSQRQKYHSATENYNTVELRCKSVCTFPRKPKSALPNLPVDADPVYAQPFETDTATKKTSGTAANKKDDLYNTHIYAEPIDSKRNTPNHILVNTDSLQVRTDKRLSATRSNLENSLASSIQIDQQNCDKKCAIYDSSGSTNLNSLKIAKEVCIYSHSEENELGPLKTNLEYLELL